MEINRSHILLYGGGCTGKSASLATILKLVPKRPKQRVIVLSTENNCIAGLQWGLRYQNIPLEENQLFFSEAKPKQKRAFKSKIAAFKKFAENTVTQNYSTAKDSTQNKDKYTYLIDVLAKLEELKAIDQFTDKEVAFGNIADLEEQDVLIVDGLTPIVHGIWNLVQGDKLVNDQNDYQIVQKQVKDITQELVSSLNCSLVLLAHEERDKKDMIRPAINCGQALHGSYIGAFTDTIYSYKSNANKFFWAGKKLNVETAARNFPAAENLEQDFSKYEFFVKG